MTPQINYPSHILTSNERSRYGDDQSSGPATSHGSTRSPLRKRPEVFYGRTHTLNGKGLRHRIFTKRTPRAATQTPVKVKRTQKTSHLPHFQRPRPEQSQLILQKSERAAILSRSFLSNGDVRFVISVGSGPTGTQRTVSLKELPDFVSLQDLHDFENGQFAQALEAEEENANLRHKRRCPPERSGGSVAKFVERSAGYHGGVGDATSSLQGPLVRPVGGGKFKGSRGSSNETDQGDGRTSDTTGTSTPVIEDDMSEMGVPNAQNSRNIATLPNLQHRRDSLKERCIRTETLSQSKGKFNSSGDENCHLETVPAPSASTLSYSTKLEDENEINDAAVLLRQFQESQVFGLEQRPEPLIRGNITDSTRRPQPANVSVLTISSIGTEPNSGTQPTSSTSAVDPARKRRLSDTSILTEYGQRLPEPKKSKVESDDEIENGEWLTGPPGLFPPESEDEVDDDPQKKWALNPNRRVEAILADKITRVRGRSVRQYRIKWLGCPTSQNSWENEDDLHMADVVLKDYRVDRAVRKMRERSSYERQTLKKRERSSYDRQTIIIDLTQDDE